MESEVEAPQPMCFRCSKQLGNDPGLKNEAKQDGQDTLKLQFKPEEDQDENEEGTDQVRWITRTLWN